MVLSCVSTASVWTPTMITTSEWKSRNFQRVTKPFGFFVANHSAFLWQIIRLFCGNSTISKIFSFLFKVPNDSTISSFPLTRVGHNYYLFLYYSFIFSSGIFFLPEQIRIQSFSVSLCRYDVLSLLNGTK